MTTQPEPLRLAESISQMDTFTEHQRGEILKAAAELRRLVALNQELLGVLLMYQKAGVGNSIDRISIFEADQAARALIAKAEGRA